MNESTSSSSSFLHQICNIFNFRCIVYQGICLKSEIRLFCVLLTEWKYIYIFKPEDRQIPSFAYPRVFFLLFVPDTGNTYASFKSGEKSIFLIYFKIKDNGDLKIIFFCEQQLPLVFVSLCLVPTGSWNYNKSLPNTKLDPGVLLLDSAIWCLWSLT